MDEKISEEIGDAWPTELEALSHQAEVFLRVNTTKISKEDLIKLLQEKDVDLEISHRETEDLEVVRKNIISMKRM